MNCPLCNASNRDDAKFCKVCGKSLPVAANVGAQFIAPNPGATRPIPIQGAGAGGEVNAQADQDAAYDIGNEPTVVLTQEQLLAYQHKRQNGEAVLPVGQSAAPGADVPSDAPSTVGVQVIAPTVPPAASTDAQPTEGTDVAEMPTLIIDAAALPSPQGSPNEPAVPSSAPASPVTNDAATPPPVVEDTSSPTQVDAASTSAGPVENRGAQASASQEFTMLAIGASLDGRYEITQLISEAPEEHIYQVIDHQGYQHCWNCDSEENAKGDEFCNNCGAVLLGASYAMHEYPATAQAADDAHVLHGQIVRTFVDQGQTYVIEKPQVVQEAFPNGVHLLAASNSDAGDVRRSEPNEDSTLVLQLQRIHESLATPVGVYIVADGMGGHDSGQVASRTTINVIADRLLRELLDKPLAAEKNGEAVQPLDENVLGTMFCSAIEEANATLVQLNQGNKTDMGTTITGFMVVGEHAYIINVGDSRTYMLRGGQLYQLTTDHSLVAQLVAGGLIEPDDVYTHPSRSQIFRSLGDKANVQVDLFKQQLLPGDMLLSCSDGLWEMVRNPQIESILKQAPDVQMACAQLLDAANANGGEDNVSAVVVVVR